MNEILVTEWDIRRAECICFQSERKEFKNKLRIEAEEILDMRDVLLAGRR